MSTKTGKVLSVGFDVDTEKADKSGSYPAWQLVYSNAGKVENLVKHMNSLKFTPGLRSSLEGLQPGDDVTITFEKKGQFNEITAITKGIVDTPSVVASAPTTKVTGSNYETKEERAARQRLIVRQSSITAALGYYNARGEEVPADPQDVFDLAEAFCDWVFENNKTTKEVE